MKKILIMMLSLLGMTQLAAQDYEYTPFVREGVKWVCTHGYSSNPFTLELKGDYEINGKTYKAMHKYSGQAINHENDTIPVYLREEGRVVYGIVPGGKLYSDCPIGIENDQAMENMIKSGKEFVLYDFNDLESFIESFLSFCYYKHKVISDMTTIGGNDAKRCIFRHVGHDYCIIEGIGCDGIPFGYPLAINAANSDGLHLSHVIENGKEIYRSEFYRQRPQGDNILPIAREGVTWVNERVTVQAGITTRQYYCYEFSGMDSRKNPICYTYTGDNLDTSTATAIAKFQNPYYMGLVNGSIYDNEPYEKVMSEGRNMINIGTALPGYYQLYSFNETYSDINYSAVNYYIYNQREEFLTRQNFTEVDPVEIEGVQCRRYAYVDESGEVQAYLVEGIGFDSRDMGDLLTPFTRKPDPDADYQEWCGLSHVIKDGKIIYKGLRYDAAAVEALQEGKSGDVNGDGMVDVADVTAMIEMVLNGPRPNRLPADMDSDGTIDITDVTWLIEVVLGTR